MPNTCPKCGTDYPSATVICIHCGVDLRTGSELETEADPVRGPSAGMRALQFVGDLMPGLFRPVLLIVALLVAIAGFAIMSLGLAIFFMGAVFGAVAIMAAGLIVYAQAIGWVLTGSFSLLSECLAELDGNQWTLFFVVLFAPIVLLLIAFNLAAGQMPAE
ncbi:MAG: hypothetical protein ABIF82_12390 [Planctomycetota bacterium]